MAHEGLRPSGCGKGEFPVKTWPPLNLLFWCWETWIPASRKGECGWENSTEYHCTPTEVFLSFHSRWDVLRLLQLWLKAQAIQLAQGPIKPTGSIYRAQLGVKRCSGICLLVGTSGKGLGCSLTLEPVPTMNRLCTRQVHASDPAKVPPCGPSGTGHLLVRQMAN